MPNNMHRVILLGAGFLLLMHGAALAQPSSLAVSVSGGLIPSLSSPCIDRPDYFFYPEVQVESQFATFGAKTLSAHGAVYYGYWSDGGEALVNRCIDYTIVSSLSEHVVGARLFVVGEKGFLPVMVSLGLARHFAFSDYLSGDSWGVPGQDRRFAYTSAEVGLHVRIPVVGGLEVQGGVRRFVRLPIEGHLIKAFVEGERRAYQVGVVYTLLRR